MSRFLNYASLASPATCILLLDEEAQFVFNQMDDEDDMFEPSVTSGYNVEGDEDYGEDNGIGDFIDTDFGSLDYLDVAAAEFEDAEYDVEGYGDLIDALIELDN